MSDNSRKALNIVLSVVIAIVGWCYVVYNYVPNTNVTYKDIPIVFVGEDALASKGFGIAEVSKDSISVTLNQKRVSTSDITSDDIMVVADVSNAVEGDNGISLEITSPEGTQVVERDTRSISVKVEHADSKTVDIMVAYADQEEPVTEPMAVEFSSERATVVGAGSEIEKVDKAVAFLDADETTENVRNFSRDLVCVDKNGNVMPFMVIYPSEVKFNATTGVLKTVRLNVNAVDKSHDNFKRTVDAPDYLVIKGSPDVLSEIETIDTTEISLGGIYEDTEIELEYILPDGVMVANDSLGTKAVITVTEVEEKEEEEADKEAGKTGSKE